MQRFSVLSGTGQSGGDGNGNRSVEALAQLWCQVRELRGTPAPDAAHLAGFLAGLSALEWDKLESVLTLAAWGREQPDDFSLISWAASCTRPALLTQLAGHGLEFTGSVLFSCGLVLREQGWDMQARLAQLASNPDDVDTLRAMLPDPVVRADTQAVGQAVPSPELGFDEVPPFDEDTATDWLDEPTGGEVVENISAHWNAWETMDERPGLPVSSASSVPSALPLLPTRFEREAPPSPAAAAIASRQRAWDKDEVQRPKQPHQRLRLFGKSAAHTLEVTGHRRGDDFMGTHVVSIDSAAAHGTGGTYAWERKLVVQLTPEEMPAIVATLMGLTPSARFGNHGADKSKFIEVHRQEDGLVIVTGDKASSYSVPVPTRTAYYVLDLLCRAMAMSQNGPGRSASDILVLVRAVHGF